MRMWIRDWTPVPCVGRQTLLIHCATREVQTRNHFLIIILMYLRKIFLIQNHNDFSANLKKNTYCIWPSLLKIIFKWIFLLNYKFWNLVVKFLRSVILFYLYKRLVVTFRGTFHWVYNPIFKLNSLKCLSCFKLYSYS